MEQATAAIDANIRSFLSSRFSDAIVREDTFRKQLSFFIKPEFLVEICEALYEDANIQMNFLADITSLDWLNNPQEAEGRFEVVYNLYSMKHHYRLLLKVRLGGENPHVPTLVDLFAGANWMEREVFDLMGIYFDGHPEMTKILTADELEGHPLRKDFPLTYEQPAFSWNKNDPPEVIK